MKDILSELRPPRKKSTRTRVCLSIDENLYKKARDVQAFLIKETNKNFSFSKVIEEILEEGLKDGKFSEEKKHE